MARLDRFELQDRQIDSLVDADPKQHGSLQRLHLVRVRQARTHQGHLHGFRQHDFNHAQTIVFSRCAIRFPAVQSLSGANSRRRTCLHAHSEHARAFHAHAHLPALVSPLHSRRSVLAVGQDPVLQVRARHTQSCVRPTVSATRRPSAQYWNHVYGRRGGTVLSRDRLYRGRTRQRGKRGVCIRNVSSAQIRCEYLE